MEMHQPCADEAMARMPDWAEKEAERIVDEFVASERSDDLLQLQQAIAVAMRDAYERGKGIKPGGLSVE